MKKIHIAAAAAGIAIAVVGCTTTPGGADLDQMAQDMLRSGFHTRGIATLAARVCDDLSVDFVPTEAFVKELASRLHNRDLNTVPPFDRRNASAENVALWVADEIAKAGLLRDGARLEEVTVWEGTRNSVTYRP